VHVVVGSSTFDVSSRPLVIGMIAPGVGDEDVTGIALAMVRAGADAIEAGGPTRAASVRVAVDVPVIGPGEVAGVIADDAAAVAVAVVRGARVVRTGDVHAARRVVDVLAAVRTAAQSPSRP
jgi:hypothetical protein